MLIKKNFVSNPSLQEEIRDWLKLSLPTLSGEPLFVFSLVINEVVQNVLRYVYHGEQGKNIVITISQDSQAIYTAAIQDFGAPCQPHLFLDVARQPTEKGGMGIALVKKNTLSFSISENRQGNLAHLRFDAASVKH